MVSLAQVVDVFISFLEGIRPRWLRKWFASSFIVVYSYLSRCQSVLFDFRLPVYVVSGQMNESADSIRILFIGREQFPLFLVDLLFDKSPKIERVDSVFVWQVSSIDLFSFHCDMVLVSVDRFYERWIRKADLFVFPHLVHMIVDVSSPMDDFYTSLSSSAKADVRKVRNKGFFYDVVSSLDLLEFFYNHMYLPLIRNRFADKPLYTPPFVFFVLLHLIGYQLLLVKDESGEYVSGCYFEKGDNALFSRYNGVVNGDVSLIKEGVESALYYFLIDWAKKNGFSSVDFGYCRPFKQDGVFRYKRKWGAEMMRSKGSHTPDVFGLRIVKKESVLQDFFKKNPFFWIDKKNRFVEYSRKNNE